MSFVCIADQDDNNGMIAPRVGTGHSAKNMIRLLIAGSQAGCLIGVSGHSIAEIRNSSGATVQIMAPNHLPSCASAHESDRLVQVEVCWICIHSFSHLVLGCMLSADC